MSITGIYKMPYLGGVPSPSRISLRASGLDGLIRWDAIFFGGHMGIAHQPFSGPFKSNQAEQAALPSGTFLRNFEICPHCERVGRPALVERLNEAGPVISRSDGISFHLVLGDRPISFPAEKSSGKTDMLTAGFWYMRSRNDDEPPVTETVVVLLRRPPGRGTALMHCLETVADKLAEKLIKADWLATFYEFDGHRLGRIS